MHEESTTTFRRGATRPSRREVRGAIEVLESLLIPRPKREWDSDRARREAAEELANDMWARDTATVVAAIEHWATRMTPAEADLCEEQRNRQATIEDLAAKLTEIAQRFENETDAFEAHDECEDCDAVATAEMVARKGDDFNA